MWPKKDESPNQNDRKEQCMGIALMEPDSYKLEQQEKNSVKSQSKTRLDTQKNFFKIRRKNFDDKSNNKYSMLYFLDFVL